jgi:outer membrane immunogenic protein
MRLRIITPAMFLLAVMSVLVAQAHAQAAQPVKPNQPVPRQLALNYNWAHSNAPPGGCGCFSLNGGSTQLAWPIARTKFSLIADFAMVTQPDALSSGRSLRLDTYLGGAQYRPLKSKGRWQPFAEALIGGVHPSGTMITPNAVTRNPALSFAGTVGGGLDLQLNRRWLWRTAQVNYLATTVNNGVNDHQNVLVVKTGIVLRF